MPDYLLLMHNDATQSEKDEDWGAYLAGLRESGKFDGGSAIGTGVCVRKSGAVPDVADHLTGFLRVRAGDLQEAVRLVTGNPVYEAGGTVEIRELPRTG